MFPIADVGTKDIGMCAAGLNSSFNEDLIVLNLFYC